MRLPSSRRLRPVLAIAAVLLLIALDFAAAQRGPEKGAPNPYLNGIGRYYKGPRGLTSYMPAALAHPFPATMAQDVPPKLGIAPEHPAMLSSRFGLRTHPAHT